MVDVKVTNIVPCPSIERSRQRQLCFSILASLINCDILLMVARVISLRSWIGS